MSLKKHLATCCAVLAICVAASPAVYADTTLTMQANSVAGDAADYSGYQIKWYTTGVDGSRTENATILTDASGTCTLTIPDDAFGVGYEIYTDTGEKVSDFKQLLTGGLQYRDTNTPVWFDLAPKASQMQSDLTIVNDDDSVTSLDLSHFGISGSTTQGDTSTNTPTDTATQPSVQTPEYTGKVRVVSDVNIDLLRNQGITFYATQGGQQSRIDIALLPYDYADFALPSSGSFTFSISSSAVSAWSSVDVTNTGDNMAEIKVVPKCLLYVTNGGNEVQAQILNSGYKHPDKITLGVKNGEEYTIVDMTTNKAYRFVVPSNVTECALDFSTMDGVPVNELAQQDATLTNTGDFDNPYNVPLTSEHTNAEEFGEQVARQVIPAITSFPNLDDPLKHYAVFECCVLGLMLCVTVIGLISHYNNKKGVKHTRFICGGKTGIRGVFCYLKALWAIRKYTPEQRQGLGFVSNSIKDTNLPLVLWTDDNSEE